MTWHEQWKNTILKHWETEGEAFNDSLQYGVNILPIGLQSYGGLMYRVMGVHHLTQAENGNNHIAFCELLDKNNNRIQWGRLEWTRDGGQGEWWEVVVDKPDTEPASQITLYPNMSNIQIRVTRASSFPSEIVAGLNGKYPQFDEYNHSFYVVFKQMPAIIEDDPPDNEPKALVLSAKSGLIVPVYAGPSGEYRYLGDLAEGVLYSIVGAAQTPEWWVIDYGGINGYVHYLQIQHNVTEEDTVKTIPDPDLPDPDPPDPDPIPLDVGGVEVRYYDDTEPGEINPQSAVTSVKPDETESTIGYTAIFLDKGAITQMIDDPNNTSDWVTVYIETIKQRSMNKRYNEDRS